MADKPKWKRFEDLVASVQKSLSPDATVTQNEKVLGKSGTRRDVDISVRRIIGQYNLLIAIDCKDYNRPIDIKDVEEFIGLVKDIGANKGAIISALGFTEAAKKRATNSGIDLHRVIDTRDHEWKAYVSIPAVVDYRELSKFNLKFSGTGYIEYEAQDIRLMTLYNANGDVIDNINNLLSDMWKDSKISMEPGRYTSIKLCDIDTYIKTKDVLYRVDVYAEVEVIQKVFFGQLPLEEISGVSDELRGGITTSSFTTKGISIEHVINNWQCIPSVDELSVTPVLVICMTNHIQRMGL